jgi:hypothetical protein
MISANQLALLVERFCGLVNPVPESCGEAALFERPPSAMRSSAS